MTVKQFVAQVKSQTPHGHQWLDKFEAATEVAITNDPDWKVPDDKDEFLTEFGCFMAIAVLHPDDLIENFETPSMRYVGRMN